MTVLQSLKEQAGMADHPLAGRVACRLIVLEPAAQLARGQWVSCQRLQVIAPESRNAVQARTRLEKETARKGLTPTQTQAGASIVALEELGHPWIKARCRFAKPDNGPAPTCQWIKSSTTSAFASPACARPRACLACRIARRTPSVPTFECKSWGTPHAARQTPPNLRWAHDGRSPIA